MKTITFKPIFLSVIPESIKEEKLYISIEYNTAIHKCACGCGEEVVTPLTPNDWTLIYNGENVSLYPSIGNWSYVCRSHYWIKEGNIVWAENWTDEKIRRVRNEERKRLKKEKNRGSIGSMLKRFINR
jgi:hypothetical protein